MVPLGEGVLLLLLDDVEDLPGSAVILLLSADGVFDDELEPVPEAPIDWALELPWDDALDLPGSADILALSDDDEDVEAAGELLPEGELVLLLVDDGVLLADDGAVLLDAPIDCVLDELSLADWLDLFSAAFLSESSFAASTLSFTFSAPCLVLSPIFLKVSLMRSVMDSPDEWLSVAAGVEPGFSCWAMAPVAATASVQARATKLRFMGISLRWRDAASWPGGSSLSLSDLAGIARRSRKLPCSG